MRNILWFALTALLIAPETESATLTANSTSAHLTPDNFVTLRETVNHNEVANTAASLNRVKASVRVRGEGNLG